MVAVLSRVFLGEAITGRVWVAIALGMSGMLLLSLAMILMMLLRPSGMIPARARYAHPENMKQGGAQ